MDLTFRPMEEGDLGFVFDSWGRSLRPCYGDVAQADYLDCLRLHVKEQLAGAIHTRVAYMPEAPSLIVGWVIGSPPHRVDYCYTRSEFRRGGVMKRLLAHAGYKLDELETFSRLSTEARAICRSHRVKVLPVF